MEKVYLPINLVNMISVLIMVGLGTTMLGFIISGIKVWQDNSNV